MADDKILPESSAAPGDITEQKCPACGGSMSFDPARGLLVCDYCKTTKEIPKKPEKKPSDVRMKGFDFNSLNEKASVPDAENLPVSSCVSCGAELIVPASQIALTCPYCGNNLVLTDKVSGNLRPDGVIPFRITPKELPAAVTRFYKDKALLPKRFFSDSTMGRVTGVYVPFWVFSGGVKGIITYNAQRINKYKSGNYEVTDTTDYILERDVNMSFKDVPVDVSGKVDDKLMDSLEPFNMNDVQPFNMQYLAGFTADRFDVPKDEVEERAKNRMINSAFSAASAAAGSGYSNVHKRGGRLDFDIDAKYLLLPVYLFEIAFENKKYSFAVNGQSGKVVGQIPTDNKVSVEYFIKRLIPVMAAVIGIFIVKYFGGG